MPLSSTIQIIFVPSNTKLIERKQLVIFGIKPCLIEFSTIGCMISGGMNILSGSNSSLTFIENSKLSNQLFKLCEGYGGAFFGAHIVNGKFRYVETPQVAIYVGVNVDFYNFNKIFIDEPAPIASYYSDTYKAGCIYSPLLPGHVEPISSLSTNEVKERMYEIISF